MIAIPGYTVEEELAATRSGSMIRARRGTDGARVIILLQNVRDGDSPTDAPFAAERGFLAEYASPHVLSVVDQLPLRTGSALVMEHFPGIPLSALLTRGGVPFAEFLEIGIAFSTALAALHDDGVLHCGLAPHALLWDASSHQLKLTSFARAMRHGRTSTFGETALSDPALVPYIAPEQTGRLNRGIDARSDLYAAGCVLYHCLTGQPPFAGNDTMELVHSHLAREAPIPSRQVEDLPPVIDRIFRKLLSKDADSRYLSAAGLRADLLRCQDALERDGRIDDFEPALEDRAAAFRIPQQLFGRKEEIAQLHACFRVCREGNMTSLIIAGYTGVGKTALVQELIPVVAAQRGYFIKGKADQIRREIPYSTLTNAIRDLVTQILTEQQDRIDHWRARFQTALRGVAGVVTRLLPELEYFLDEVPALEELRQSEATERFREAMRRLLAAISDRTHPLVLFIDDLQWVDRETLLLLSSMVEGDPPPYLMFIGAMRSHEADDAHPVWQMISALQNHRGHHGVIELTSLPRDTVRQLLAETLSSSPDHVIELADILYAKTQGNPFFLKQFLMILHDTGMLRFDPAIRSWTWEKDEIHDLPHSENVILLLSQRMKAWPDETRRALTTAAFLGGTFTLFTVAAVAEDDGAELIRKLQPAIDAGLIVPAESGDRPVSQVPGNGTRDRTFRFLHDRVQQTAYDLMPEELRPVSHLKIGRELLRQIPRERMEEFAFAIADQLNAGRDLIDDVQERRELASLNFTAGKKAAESVAFSSAATYFTHALHLLPDGWEQDQALRWDMTHQLGRAQYALGNHEEARRLFEELSRRARSLEQKIQALMEQVHMLIHFSRYQEALDLGREGLGMLGQRIPRKISRLHVAVELLRAERTHRRRTPEELASLPPMRDTNARYAVDLMCTLLTAAYFASKNTIAFFNCRMMRLVCTKGWLESAPYVYSQYGLILGAGIGRYQRAFDIAQIGIRMTGDGKYPFWYSRTHLAMGAVVNHWIHDAADDLDYLETSAQYAKASGDLLFGLYPGGFTIQTLHFLGRPLIEVEQAVSAQLAYCSRISHPARATEDIRQLLLDVRGKSSRPGDFDVDGYDVDTVREELLRSGDSTSVVQFHILRMIALYLAGRFAEAADAMADARRGIDAAFGQLVHVDYVLYAGLTAAALMRGEEGNRAVLRKQLKRHVRQLRKWSRHSPQNFRRRLLLLEAESFSIDGDSGRAIARYEEALTEAAARNDLQVEALAAHCAARHAQANTLPGLVRTYAHRAMHAYGDWGALRCADRCLEEFSAATARRAPGATADPPPASRTTEARMTAERQSAASYDIDSLLKAAAAITGEIRLPELLDRLMSIMIQNAGAERGVLFLEEEGNLQAAAAWDPSSEQTIMQTRLLAEAADRIPMRIVNYVYRTKKAIVLDDASAHERFSAYERVREHGVRSVLCGAILYQSQIVGVVYLENNLSAGAFSAERMEILQMLSAQVSTALMNARLYAHLEEARRSLQEYSEGLERKVQERTADLEQREQDLRMSNERLAAALTTLQQTQTQLIQTEKMASLGELTAGIAHEIQNPLNFIQNFAELCIELVHEIEPGRLPSTSAAAEDDAIEDSLRILIDIATKIREHSVRASAIVRSMLDHSRMGGQERVFTDINDLIEDALQLSLNGFMARSGKFLVDVERDYDRTLPAIELVPADISRVFINLISNGLHFLRQKLDEEGRSFRPNLRVSTTARADTVTCRVRDNGPGIQKDLLGKVFQPFFTTKPSGEGTGLGLSIVYTIVVEGHRGDMTVSSEEGAWTEFTVTLPLVRGEDSDTEVPVN